MVNKQTIAVSLTAVFLMVGLAGMPTASLADSTGAAKCLKTVDKIFLKLLRISSKASNKACKAGGTEEALLDEFDAVLARAQKVIDKGEKKYSKLGCNEEEPDLPAEIDLGTVTAEGLAIYYLDVFQYPDYEPLCDGLPSL